MPKRCSSHEDCPEHSIATLFGQVVVRRPRFRCTACGVIDVGSEWPSHCQSTPKMYRVQAHLSALMACRAAADSGADVPRRISSNALASDMSLGSISSQSCLTLGRSRSGY